MSFKMDDSDIKPVSDEEMAEIEKERKKKLKENEVKNAEKKTKKKK